MAQPADEWLEADGLGGFAMGTAGLVPTRRYHGLLQVATTPPTGRMMLVNGVEAWIDCGAGPVALSSSRYVPGVVHPDGASRIAAFEHEPWPRWTFGIPAHHEAGAEVVHEVFAVHRSPLVVLSWRLARPRQRARLSVRIFLSGRAAHALHSENGAFRFDAAVAGERVRFEPYADVPAVRAIANGSYEHAPEWYRSFLYEEERARGFDSVEDLASPGTFELDLGRGEAWILLGAEGAALPALGLDPRAGAAQLGAELREKERARRAAFGSPLARTADQYLVTRGPDRSGGAGDLAGASIVAGYPWFTDWGRDTFVALRGLCLAAGRLGEARAILRTWAGMVSEGMLPNCFPDRGREPEFNSVDAPLWLAVAAAELRAASEAARETIPADERRTFDAALDRALTAILTGYARGTRYGIRADGDGLLACGAPGWQLTWMDAKVGDHVVTPRIGKPVEVQALWIHALAAGGELDPRWKELRARAERSFRARFWSEELGHLHDVVDVDHVPGTCDSSLRPNQILAVGGLPSSLLRPEHARSVVERVERALWTPLGLRSLAPDDPRYARTYTGGASERDAAYHQGTAWPWLAGPFVEAWLRVRGSTQKAKEEARRRFLAPLLEHLGVAGLGHVSEIADGAPPHTPRGCPFQAWSLGELLRMRRLLGEDSQAPKPRVQPARRSADR